VYPFDAVEPFFQSVHARVWTDGSEDLSGLSPLESAIYATRVLEDDIDNGGHYQAFGNGTDQLIEPAIEGYEHLGLPAYAAHFRHVRAIGFHEHSPEEVGESLDDAYFRLSGSEEARAVAIYRAFGD
jgi:hypothetical protein